MYVFAIHVRRRDVEIEEMQVNRLACLRLTERCATILFSIREEIAEAGDQIGEELLYPIARLVE